MEAIFSGPWARLNCNFYQLIDEFSRSMFFFRRLILFDFRLESSFRLFGGGKSFVFEFTDAAVLIQENINELRDG